MKKNIIPAGFSEPEFQSLIESIFLNDFRNNIQFDVSFHSGTDENKLGYDIEIGTYVPIFLQVKLADLKIHPTKGELDVRKNTYKYRDSPGAYFFQLHVDDKAKDYLQHNLLYNLNFPGSYAKYISPLFIERDLLKQLKYNIPVLERERPYRLKLQDGSSEYSWDNNFSLMHSILINPHKEVHKVPRELHKYFFNRRCQISFHSEPEKVQRENASFLRDFIAEVNGRIGSTENTDEGNFQTIFYAVIKAVKNTFKADENWEEREKDILNIIFEHESDDEDLVRVVDNFGELQPNYEDFRVLCKYIERRFSISTMLVSKRSAFYSYYL